MPDEPSLSARLLELLDAPMVRRYWRILRALHVVRLAASVVLVVAVMATVVQVITR